MSLISKVTTRVCSGPLRCPASRVGLEVRDISLPPSMPVDSLLPLFPCAFPLLSLILCAFSVLSLLLLAFSLFC